MNTQQQFMSELNALLRKWDATMDADAQYVGYGAGPPFIEVYVPPIYKDGEKVREGFTADVGSSLDGSES